jgi:HEAT repeat protein
MRAGSWEQRTIAHEFLLRLPYPIAEDLQPLQSWDGIPSQELADVLPKLGAEIVPLLLRLLHSANSQVRVGASWALGVVSDPASAVGLVAALSDPHPEVRLNAVHALCNLPHPEAVNPLTRLLLDADWRVRKAATTALIRIGVGAVPALRRMLQSEALADKRVAIGVLGHIGDLSVIDDLLPHVEHSSVDLRAVAVIALGQLRAEEAVPALTQCVNDDTRPSWSKHSIAELARQALESIGTEEAMWVMKTLFLRDEPKSKEVGKRRLQKDKSDSQVISTSSLAADEHEAPAVLDDSQSGLSDQASAVTPLPHQRDDELDTLLRQLSTLPWPERQLASKELIAYARRYHKRCPLDVLYRLQVGVYHEDAYVRWVIAEALGLIAHPEAARTLEVLLNDTDWTVRSTAVHALAEVGDPESLPLVLQLLKDRREDVRANVAEEVVRFNCPQAVPALIETLNDESLFVKQQVIRSLGRLGDARAVPALVELLQAPHTDVYQRALILEALGKIGSDEAVEAVGQLLSSTEKPNLKHGLTLGEIAAETLEQIGSPAALRLLAAWSKSRKYV